MTTKLIKLFSVAALSLSVAALALPANAQSFGFGKKESSVDWGDVSTQSDAALINLYQGQATLSSAVADLADILELQDEAAGLRASAQAVSECGASSCSEFSEVTEQDAKVQEQVVAELERQAESLSDDQKAKAEEALKKYVVGGIQFATGLKDARRLGEIAADAPMLQKPKFLGLIKAVPTAAKGAANIAQTAPTLFNIATAADIKKPEGGDEMLGMI
ncbi:hypothetical protein CWE21_00555 [Pseudidiomarina aquimaris]|uniref:Uncharacterized protein n=1 Tax=Pseudidiomarina aquimaris TaxID=641841 RepID=A0A432XPK7_9GAMM|nr:hypothetical protein [Pseudidiomarina aquimaris]RUO50630.1 hypothetical protein CWE21_00555 [Pseudidiomarina aquimaris]